jgi:inorganic pyrophosphatase
MDSMDETLVPITGGGDLDNEKPSMSSRGSFGSDNDLGIHTEGVEDTLEYRIKAKSECGKVISLWHDISLTYIDTETQQETTNLNFVCEIPKFTRKKYEIATDEVGNPIKQDEKKGVLREFKKGDIFFNYGCLPQTWEDPTFIHPDAEGCRGDNDPLDICEIGARIILPGAVRPVKVLGVLCMIDEGEADWKVVVIDAEDKWAPFMDDIEDVEKEMPGMLDAIREWFRTYKIPDGKPPNVFGLDEKFMNKKYANEVIEECHHAWQELVSGEKERKVAEGAHDDEVKKLVRKLSKNSLFALAPEIDAHPEAHPEDYEDDEATFF